MRNVIKSKKLFLITIFQLLIVSIVLPQDDWISFGTSGIPQKANLQVVHFNAQNIRTDINIPGMLSKRLSTKGGDFTRLTLIDYGYITKIGKPQLPVIRELIETPYGANFSFEVINATYQEVDLAEVGIDTKIIPV